MAFTGPSSKSDHSETGWQVFEAPGVEPVFPEKRQAIDYAQCRASFRSGEIRILDSTGKVERAIAFNEKDRRL
jgi:hypothetical protein